MYRKTNADPNHICGNCKKLGTKQCARNFGKMDKRIKDYRIGKTDLGKAFIFVYDCEGFDMDIPLAEDNGYFKKNKVPNQLRCTEMIASIKALISADKGLTPVDRQHLMENKDFNSQIEKLLRMLGRYTNEKPF